MPTRQDGQLTTVVSYTERGEGGNNQYRGNCSPRLIEDLIGHFRPQQICDYMCGSNSTRDAANAMGIQSVTGDLHSGFDMLKHDIRECPEFIFWHPPYYDIIIYSDKMYSAVDVQQKYGYDPRNSGLSRMPSWEEFVKAMNYCMMKQFNALERGGRMAVLVGDIKKRGKLYSMIFELAKPGTMENVVIKTQHNCVSDKRQYTNMMIMSGRWLIWTTGARIRILVNWASGKAKPPAGAIRTTGRTTPCLCITSYSAATIWACVRSPLPISVVCGGLTPKMIMLPDESTVTLLGRR